MIYRNLNEPKPGRSPKSDLLSHAKNEIELNRLFLHTSDPVINYKSKMIIGIHEGFMKGIYRIKSESFSEYIQLFYLMGQSFYNGTRLLPFNDSIMIPPEDIKSHLGSGGIFDILQGYYKIIDAFYTKV